MISLYRLQLLVFILCTSIIPGMVHATHIVGGEFSLTRISGNNYEIRLTLYFDAINGSPGALDQSAKIYIFNKRTNQVVDSSTLLRVPDQIFVPYTNPQCAIPDLRTRLLTYRNNYIFTADKYSEPAGYYMVWERCCRNGGISNIQNPGATGQAFYMEFPAKFTPQGIPIVDNTPQFVPIKGDYACVFSNFTMNFKAIDPDGDSLVYDLVSPIWGNSSDQQGFIVNLPPIPAPYKRVQWMPGYDSTMMIPGNPPLSINRSTGMLNLTANQVGLFVFAVRVAQFRNGVKIGEVRREYQLKTIDCQPNDPPGINLQAVNSTGGFLRGDTLYVNARKSNCVELNIADPQANQDVTIRVLPRNFNGNQTLLATTRNTGNNADTLKFRVCFESCRPTPAQTPLIMDILTSDNGCPQSKTDSARLYVVVLPPLPPKPKIFFNNPDWADDTLTYTVGQDFELLVTAIDSSLGILQQQAYIITPTGDTLQPSVLGLSATQLINNAERQVLRYSGRLDCSPYINQLLQFVHIVRTNICDSSAYDTTRLYIIIKPIPGSRPYITLTGADAQAAMSGKVRLKYGDTLQFTVVINDTTGGFIFSEFVISDTLGRVISKPANLTYQANNGFLLLQMPFMWKIGCIDFGKAYDVYFIAHTLPQCLAKLYDTLKVRIVIDNNLAKPVININEARLQAFLEEGRFERVELQTFKVAVGQTLLVPLIASDIENKVIQLQARPIGFNLRSQMMTFENKAGIGPLESVLTWTPTCGQLSRMGGYEITFVTTKNVCGFVKSDSLRLKLLPIDSTFRDFDVPNLLTANADGLNDVFNLSSQLPPDNCTTKFEKVEIYTRWGKKIFEERERNFSWKPSAGEAGMYFYILHFNDRKIKGWLQVIN